MFKILVIALLTALSSGPALAVETFAYSAGKIAVAMAYKPLRHVMGNKPFNAVVVVGDKVEFLSGACKYTVELTGIPLEYGSMEVEYHVAQMTGPICAPTR